MVVGLGSNCLRKWCLHESNSVPTLNKGNPGDSRGPPLSPPTQARRRYVDYCLWGPMANADSARLSGLLLVWSIVHDISGRVWTGRPDRAQVLPERRRPPDDHLRRPRLQHHWVSRYGSGWTEARKRCLVRRERLVVARDMMPFHLPPLIDRPVGVCPDQIMTPLFGTCTSFRPHICWPPCRDRYIMA